jgi:hypothetical protein
MIPITILGLMVILAVALVHGSRRWQSATAAMHAALEAARLPIQPRHYDAQKLEGARAHRGWQGGSDTLGRPLEPPRTARRDTGPHRRRGGVDVSRGAKTLLARAHYPARL